MQVQIVYTFADFFVLFFICLILCNCIFLTKNKEITLELYFSFHCFFFSLYVLCSPSTRRILSRSLSNALNVSCLCFFLKIL